jgi:hypothetical protein
MDDDEIHIIKIVESQDVVFLNEKKLSQSGNKYIFYLV